MTVSSDTSRWAYNGDGSTDTFAYTTEIFTNTDLDVYVDGTLKTITTHYTVTGVGSASGGNVVFTAGNIPASGTGNVVFVKDIPYTQPSSLPLGGDFPSTTVENMTDRLTILIQQVKAKINRTLRQPESDATDIATLPAKATRASTFLSFDSNGDPAATASLSGSGITLPVTVANGGTGAATAAGAATNLGLGTGDSPQFTGINVGHASDTTITRVSAGKIAVEGATVADISSAQSFAKALRGTPAEFTDGATITLDLSLANHFYGVLGGNRTLGVPSNIVAGQSGLVDFYQDQTGSRTLAYAWVWNIAGGTAGVLSTPGCSHDVLSYHVNYYGTSTVTITIATPGVVTWTAHGLKTGQKIQLTTTGALPTGLTASTTYFVIRESADTFTLATTRANAAAGTKIATSGSQSGTHTAVACEITYALNKAVA